MPCPCAEQPGIPPSPRHARLSHQAPPAASPQHQPEPRQSHRAFAADAIGQNKAVRLWLRWCGVSGRADQLIGAPATRAPGPRVMNTESARNYFGQAGRFGYARLLRSGLPPKVALPDRSAGLSQELLRTPQTSASPRHGCRSHRNPTDEAARSGTHVVHVKHTENTPSAASMRVSWAVGDFPGRCSRDDRAPENGSSVGLIIKRS